MSTDLVVRQSQEVYIPSPADWDFMVNWGRQAIQSFMLPAGIKTPEAAAIIVLKGRELGLSFMTAVAHIHVIGGKPTMSAELIQGLARRNLPGLVINILESTNLIAKVEIIRPEKGSKPYVQSFTWEDAQNAKLTGKDVWKQYPSAMLWSRCVTAALRKVCPDALMGISYTPEELGAEVDGDGNVIETSSRPVSNQATVTPIKPLDDKPKPVVANPMQPSAASSEVVDTEPNHRKALIGKIAGLRNELKITSDDLKAEVWEMFKETDPAKLNLSELCQILTMLENEKKKREPQPEWLDPKNHGPIGQGV